MLKNPLLQKAQAEIEKAVTDRDSFDKIVGAATTAIYDKKIFDRIAAGIADSENPVEDIAKGVVGILGAIATKAKGTMPPQPAVQAGMAVLMDALDFAEQAGILEVTEEVVQRATMEYVEALLPSIGVTPEKLAGALKEVQGVMSDPQKMAAYQASQKQPAQGAEGSAP